MKKVSLMVAVMSVLLAGVVNAQEISNENLRRYAIMMETVDAMKQEISDLTNEMIKNQEGMDGKRYLELAKAGGDEAKLEAAGAKDYEKKFMELVTNMQDERKQAISDVVSIMATKMLPDGGKVYKEIKSAVDSDPEVKARYEAIQKAINSAADAGA
ncbi:hypothetical protein [Fulvivirga sedimenti]|uniref:DUF4168 domain-containing protein n=1 Tax=Fulvivirga sedimenti TaxID=2879465 RepID=A0A9X1HV93_9BACT|nr:hypothetical protein [Fulvivirga sedimenti]MCA6078898.1 hypothetical protein [Fulvivirga sedimenti]